jgi:predicted RNA binding protein YcfA (HicA-like mRNA interferase family)
MDAKRLVRLLEARGFELARQSGSHAIYIHADGRRTTVPMHGKRDLGKGLLRQIMRDADLAPEDLKS